MTFPELVTIFELSGWQALGKMPDPASGQAAVRLEAARNAIDILLLLREKSRNNLTPEETRHLDAAIANLQLNYAAEQEKTRAAAAKPGDAGQAAEKQEEAAKPPADGPGASAGTDADRPPPPGAPPGEGTAEKSG